MQNIDNIVGPPVTGGNFFGRKPEVDYVWKRIELGNNFKLPSPRRVGKTSFAFKLLEIAESKGWSTIDINLEKLVKEQDFLDDFVTKLQSLSTWETIKHKGTELLDFIGRLKPKVSYGGMDLELEWKNGKEKAYKDLAHMLDHSQKTLIFFDELTVFLSLILNHGENGKQNVTAFLHWFRNIRIVKNSSIRWIICSSVGIENFTFKHGISDTLNDVPDYKLKPFSTDDSIAMLDALAASEGLQLPAHLKQGVVDKLEYCIPFFIQLIFEKITYLHRVEDMALGDQIITTAYETLIKEGHFNTWIERLTEQYGASKKNALSLLKHVCQHPNGVSRTAMEGVMGNNGVVIEHIEEELSSLIYMLTNDGYLIEDTSLYRFRSPLLRDFWFNRHVK